MSTIDTGKAIDALFKQLSGKSGPDPEKARTPKPDEGIDPLVYELIHAFMVWEAGATNAAKAMAALLGEFVDFNELRICMGDELVGILPSKYPLAQERCERLRAALNQVFAREHALSLAVLNETPKREAKAYLDTLDGMTPFVAGRVALLALGAHAFPVDERLANRLRSAGVGEAGEDAASLGARLERHFRAGQAEEAYLRLEASVGARGAAKSGGSPGSRKKTSRSRGS